MPNGFHAGPAALINLLRTLTTFAEEKIVTAQINDLFHYRNRNYSVAGISEGELFVPSVLDLMPVSTCTACWRGYRAVFGLLDKRLVLSDLHINLMKSEGRYQRQEGPDINGVKATDRKDKHDWFNNHYESLAYHLEYSGGLLIADGFLRELYVHMGFHPPWKYESVFELIFEGGILKQEFDRSERMAEIRKEFVQARPKDSSGAPLSRDEITKFVERAFDRSYRM